MSHTLTRRVLESLRRESCQRLIARVRSIPPAELPKLAGMFRVFYEDEIELLPEDLMVLYVECKLKGLL